jgi:hypothetical protein
MAEKFTKRKTLNTTSIENFIISSAWEVLQTSTKKKSPFVRVRSLRMTWQWGHSLQTCG